MIFRNNCELQIFQFWQNVQGTRCHKGRAVFQTTSSWQSSRVGVQSSVWWRELPHKVLCLDLQKKNFRLFSTRTVFGTTEDKINRQGQDLYIININFYSFDFYLVTDYAWWNQFDNATWHVWLLGVTLEISDQLQWDNDSGALAYHWDAWNCNDNGKRLGQRRSLPLPSCIVFSPGGLGGHSLLLFVFCCFYHSCQYLHILFQDGAVGRVLTWEPAENK